ncbi:MAG: hypothetical protein EP330_13175 [Deltaproteobacteria bacterium]|nr:MAG: hypothetical protein EP330_13175 [Deltaproteobacteria bacterium]
MLLTFVTFVVYSKTDAFQHQVVPVVEALVEQQTGEDFSVGRIDISYWPPGVTARELSLAHPPTQESIVTVDRVRLPLVLRQGRVQLGRVEIDRPVAHLHIEPDGKLREFRNVYRPPEIARPDPQLPWTTLEIVGGEVLVDLPEDKGQLRVRRLESRSHDDLADVSLLVQVDVAGIQESIPLTAPNATIGGRTLSFPELRIEHRVGTLEGSFAHTLGDQLAASLTGSVLLDETKPWLKEPRAVMGQAHLDVQLTGTAKQPQVSAVVLGQDVELQLPGKAWPVISYRIGDVVVAANASKKGIDIERLVLTSGPGQASASGFITPELRLERGKVVIEDLSLAHELQSKDAAPTPWVDLLGDAEIEVEGTLKPLHLEGPFDLSVANLKVGDRPIADPNVYVNLDIPHAYARGTLTLEKDHIRLKSPEVRGPRSRGAANVRIGFGPGGPLDLRFAFDHADLTDFAPLGSARLQGTGRISGRIHGLFKELTFEGFGDVQRFSVTGIPYADRLVTTLSSPDMRTIEFQDAKAWLGQSTYGGDFSMDFRDPMSLKTSLAVDKGRIQDFVGMFVQLEGLTGEMTGTLDLNGPLFDLDGEAHFDLANVDLYGEHFPTGAGHGYMDQGIFTLDDLRVTRDEGDEGIMLRGTVGRDYALNMELVADGLQVETLDILEGKDLPAFGDLSLVARIDNKIYDPAPHGRLMLTKTRWDRSALPDSTVKFQTTKGVASFEGSLLGGTTAVVGTLGLWEEQPYEVFASLSRFPAHVLYPVAADGKPFEAVASGQFSLSGHFGENPSPVDLSADVREFELSWDQHRLSNTAPWHYEQMGEFFLLEDLALAGGETRIELEELSGGDGVRAKGGGVLDLDLLRAFVPGLTRADGKASFTLDAEGKPPEVSAVADVWIEGDLVRHWSFPEAFEDVQARFVARPDQYTLVRADAGLGGGSVAAWGTIDADGWMPTRYDLHATATDAQVQWVDYLPPAIGDGELTFTGPAEDPLLGGDITIGEMTFSDRIDWEDWVVEFRDELLVDSVTGEEAYFSMDVDLHADRTIHLRNNVADGTASAELTVLGDTARPGLSGWVRIVDGVVFLADREFEVERGDVMFRDPWTWDPDLDFDLLTQIVSRERSFRVNYIVRGPFSDWRTETRSDPPLAQADVNTLLWFGVTADDLEDMGELPQAVAQGVADLILADLFISTQASDLREDIRLFDQVEIVTGVNSRGDYSSDPRLLVRKRYAEAGDLEITGEINLVQPSDQYYRLDQPLTEAWSLSGWYATFQRERTLPIGGAYGVDLRARWESD